MIHVIIPVFNRLAMTQTMVDCLRAQTCLPLLRIWVVDDGSTDGTADWLAMQADIQTVAGDGTLFWGGAVDAALCKILVIAAADDFVLLVNNDTRIAPDFVAQLLTVAQDRAPAAVGSIIRDEANPGRVLSLGARIDSWRMITRDVLSAPGHHVPSSEVMPIDALAGRGVLYPVAALWAVGGMRPQTLPHYLADYELSLRVKRAGWKLLVASAAAVLSPDEYGSTWRGKSLKEKLFSIRSPLYLPAVLAFWWQASTGLQRLTLPARLALFILFPRLRKPTQ